MKNKILFLFILLVSFIISNSFFCTKNNNCDSVDKVDILVKDILRKDYIYTFLRRDKYRINYLLSRGLIKPGKVYIGRDSIPVISIHNDTINIQAVSRISFYDIRSNYDATEVSLKVDYYSIGIIYCKTTDFHYLFDKENCKWILKDSSQFIY